MKNLRDVNSFIRSTLTSIPLVGMIDYGQQNVINEPRTFMPIQVAFVNTGFSGANSSDLVYSYLIGFYDKVRENMNDLEEVQSKMQDVIIEFISKVNRNEDYTVVSDSSEYVIAGMDRLHGYDLTIDIQVFNPEQIC